MKGFLPWLGGKNLLAKQLSKYIDTINHTCYVEPFMGAGHVFFKKTPVKVEVLNDINKDLTTLFRVLQHHLEEFLRYFKWALVSRDEFDRLNKQNPDSLTDIQRACRFYYIQKLCYGGRPVKRTFGSSTTSAPRLNLLRIEEELSQVHLRLSRVLIENHNWMEVVDRYDRKYTLFYVDPPYYNCESYYGDKIFDRSDYVKLAERFASLNGQFILSLNDHPEIRKIFKRFHFKSVNVRYSIAATGDKRKKFPELIISSADLRKISTKQP